MKSLLWVAPFFAALAISSAQAAESVSTDFINSKGEKIGTATLKDVENGTLITVDVQLPEGAHAIHIHEKPACDAPDFKTAAGHFNPKDTKPEFAGDVGNLYVEPSGHIKQEIFAPQLQLEGKNGLMHGTSIVIHEYGDEFGVSAASAGSRIACAVIKQ